MSFFGRTDAGVASEACARSMKWRHALCLLQSGNAYASEILLNTLAAWARIAMYHTKVVLSGWPLEHEAYAPEVQHELISCAWKMTRDWPCASVIFGGVEIDPRNRWVQPVLRRSFWQSCRTWVKKVEGS